MSTAVELWPWSVWMQRSWFPQVYTHSLYAEWVKQIDQRANCTHIEQGNHNPLKEHCRFIKHTPECLLQVWTKLACILACRGLHKVCTSCWGGNGGGTMVAVTATVLHWFKMRWQKRKTRKEKCIYMFLFLWVLQGVLCFSFSLPYYMQIHWTAFLPFLPYPITRACVLLQFDLSGTISSHHLMLCTISICCCDLILSFLCTIHISEPPIWLLVVLGEFRSLST